MYQISTMNLSMAVLNSWRTRSRLPSNTGDADSKCAIKRPAENQFLNDSLQAKKKFFPANSVGENQCHLTVEKCSSDEGVSSRSSNSDLNLTDLSRPSSRLSDGKRTSEGSSESKKSGESYKILTDLSLLGLKIGQNLTEAHSMIRQESNTESEMVSINSESHNKLINLLEESKELSDKVMANISSLFGVRTLGNCSSEIAELHQSRSEDKKRIEELSALVSRLERERSTYRRGRQSIPADLSTIETEMEDSGLPQLSNLSRETEEFADHVRETMTELGLTQLYLTLWSDKRQKRMNSSLVSAFVNKKLREVRYQEYIPLVKEFLEEATQPGWIDTFSAASPETTDLIERFKSTMELFNFSVQDFMNYASTKGKLQFDKRDLANFLKKFLKDDECEQMISVVQVFLEEVESLSINDKDGEEEPSTEILNLIDQMNKHMEDRGYAFQDFTRWANRQGQQCSLPLVHLFLKKKLKEDKCQAIVPLVKQYMELAVEEVIRSENRQLPEDLANTIDEQKRTMAELKLTGSKFIEWATQEGLGLSANMFSTYINKKLREDKCQVIVPILNKYLDMAKEGKISVTPMKKKEEPLQGAQSNSSDLSKENEDFICHFRRVIAEYGINNKDVADWMDSSDFDVRMTASEVKKFTTKRLNNERCNEVLPALYEFLDELTQRGSKKPSSRRHFSAEATVILEEAFRSLNSQSLDLKTCKALAEQVGDTPERVSNWFHNRKYKGKRLS